MNFITIAQSSFRVILGLDPWIHLFLDRMHGCRITPVKSEHLFHRGVLFFVITRGGMTVLNGLSVIPVLDP
uniref:Uncharacterized protein n=1 Tax=Chlorobium phaeobacteroides (strain BS1) TaxID=331678 RepID=B3EQP7_CHLPB